MSQNKKNYIPKTHTGVFFPAGVLSLFASAGF
jgi:hypothetical protein